MNIIHKILIAGVVLVILLFVAKRMFTPKRIKPVDEDEHDINSYH